MYLKKILPALTSQVSGGVVAIDPRSLSPVFWLQPTEGLYQDTAKTTAAAANDDPVGVWCDPITNVNFTRVTDDTHRATLKTNVLNGVPGVLFNGTSSALGSGLLTTGIGTGGYTLFIVCQVGDKSKCVFSRADYIPAYYPRANVATENLGIYNGGVIPFTSVISLNSYHIITFQRASAAIGLSGYVDGAAEANNPIAEGINWVANALTIGASRAAGDLGVYNKHIHEIILYASALSDANRAGIHKFLSNRYGIAVTG